MLAYIHFRTARFKLDSLARNGRKTFARHLMRHQGFIAASSLARKLMPSQRIKCLHRLIGINALMKASTFRYEILIYAWRFVASFLFNLCRSMNECVGIRWPWVSWHSFSSSFIEDTKGAGASFHKAYDISRTPEDNHLFVSPAEIEAAFHATMAWYSASCIHHSPPLFIYLSICRAAEPTSTSAKRPGYHERSANIMAEWHEIIDIKCSLL